MGLRPEGAGDFTVEVDGIGTFTFGRRRQRDVYRIRGEYNRLTGGNYAEDGNFNDFPALAHATLAVLMVQAPEGFDLNDLDPLTDDDCDSKILKVFAALREKELSFRPRTRKGGEAQGEAAGA